MCFLFENDNSYRASFLFAKFAVLYFLRFKAETFIQHVDPNVYTFRMLQFFLNS